MEYEWQEPVLTRMFRQLESNARLVRLDRRGLGMSDSAAAGSVATVEERVDDIRAVLDAVGSQKAVLAGFGDGSTNSVVFAASSSNRAAGPVLYMLLLSYRAAGEYPRIHRVAATDEERTERVEILRRLWGTHEYAARTVAFGTPSRLDAHPRPGRCSPRKCGAVVSQPGRRGAVGFARCAGVASVVDRRRLDKLAELTKRFSL